MGGGAVHWINPGDAGVQVPSLHSIWFEVDFYWETIICVFVRDWFFPFLSSCRCWWIREKHNSETDENTARKRLQCRVSVALQHMSLSHTRGTQTRGFKPLLMNNYHSFTRYIKGNLVGKRQTETVNSELNHEKKIGKAVQNVAIYNWIISCLSVNILNIWLVSNWV